MSLDRPRASAPRRLFRVGGTGALHPPAILVMSIWEILFDILVLLGGRFLLGALCERLKQSAIVGYLLAGVLLGPNALHLVAKGQEVAVLAELGVALLLFAIGLEFSWSRLRSLGSIPTVGCLDLYPTPSAAHTIR